MNIVMAGAAGLEPVTSAVTGQRSKPVELRPRNTPKRVPENAEAVNSF